MLTSKEVCDKWNIKPSDYGLLFSEESDYDRILRQTPYKETDDELFDKKSLIHWWMQSYIPDGYGNDKTDYEIYKTYSNANHKLLKYIWMGGYFPKTNQQSFNICLNKDSDIEDAEFNLSLIIPYIKSANHEDCTGKYMGVFEHTLSEGGVYSVIINDIGGNFILGITRYSRYSVIKEFDNLKDLLIYIAKNHYYQETT